MRPDAHELAEFYASPLGVMASRTIGWALHAVPRPRANEATIGIGFAGPVLEGFAPHACNLAAAEQGAQRWPHGAPSQTALCSDTALPLADSAADCIVCVHALEGSEATRAHLREIWRVLRPEGRAIFIVPNRRGLWARLDTTPFGQGRPYSRGQLTRLLSRAMFQPGKAIPCLFTPPLAWSPMLSAAASLERIGGVLWPLFSGLIVLEATKQVHAPLVEPARPRLRLVASALRPQIAPRSRAAGIPPAPPADSASRPSG